MLLLLLINLFILFVVSRNVDTVILDDDLCEDDLCEEDQVIFLKTIKER